MRKTPIAMLSLLIAVGAVALVAVPHAHGLPALQATPNFGPIVDPEDTPVPRFTPLPIAVSERPCTVTVLGANTPFYTGPDAATASGSVAQSGETLVVRQMAGEQWAETDRGWLRLDTSQLATLRSCEILAGREPERTLMGLHVINPSSDGEVLWLVQRLASSGHPLGTLKGLNGTEGLLAKTKLISPETTTVFRSLVTGEGVSDCPGGARESSDPVGIAQRWYEGLQKYWGDINADYYEYVNECPAEVSWLVDFSIEMMRQANEDGRCLLLFSFGVGSPEISDLDTLLPAYQYALDHECQPGRHHGIALHAYSMESDLPLSEADKWLAQRHTLLYEELLKMLPDADQLPLYLTEAGIGWGDVMPSCEVLANDVVQYTYQLEETPYVKGFHLWSVGNSVMWYDVTPCLETIGDALLSYYGGGN